MPIKKQEQTPVSDTQVEEIIENAAADVFADVPVIDDLYKQDEYWTDAIDMEVLAEKDSNTGIPWNIDVKEDCLIEHEMTLTPIELDDYEAQYEEEIRLF